MKQPTNSITKPTLSARALEIYSSVCDAMQPAEEAQGPEDYAELHNAIMAEAHARIAAFNSHATHTVMPDFIPTQPAFIGALHAVAENGYSNLDADNFDTKEDFDMSMSNAIEEVFSLLGLEHPQNDSLEWLGDFYDMAEEAGYIWQGEE